VNHFNQLTPSQLERLALLAEELGEAVQSVNKIIRHGYESYNPDKIVNQRGEGYPVITNRMELEKEIGDVNAAIGLLIEARDLTNEGIMAATKRKLFSVGKYLHHQPDEYVAEMAAFILNAHPGAQVNQTELGRVIAKFTDSRYDEFMAGSFSCVDLAEHLKFTFGLRWQDDKVNIAYTIQDWVDKVKTGDDESE
jgi:NTP pyrophosphatase (non-canonical NTP hydrolase)